VPVVAMCPVERPKVELVDDVKDEPGEVAFGEPVAQGRGQQEGLVARCAQEVVRHSPLYIIYHFSTNCVVLVHPATVEAARSKSTKLARLRPPRCKATGQAGTPRGGEATDCLVGVGPKGVRQGRPASGHEALGDKAPGTSCAVQVRVLSFASSARGLSLLSGGRCASRGRFPHK
jgi:hypothetical protein